MSMIGVQHTIRVQTDKLQLTSYEATNRNYNIKINLYFNILYTCRNSL